MYDAGRGRVGARRVAAVLCAMTVAAATTAVLSPNALASSDFVSFGAITSGFAFDVTLANRQTIPVVEQIEFAGPAAQAHLDSLGNSDAFASFPYPGQDVVGVPGLIAGLFGIPVPAYPAYVGTSAGDGSKSVEQPGISLRAESGENLSSGQATAGESGAPNATSTADTRLTSTGLDALSTSSADALNIGGVLRISGVRSFAEALRDAEGKVITKNHLSFAQISVPGLNLSIPKETPSQVPVPVPIPGLPQPPPITVPVLPIPFGGMTIPAPDIGFEDGTFTVTLPMPGGKPQKFAVPAQPVLDSFKAAGLTITYQAPMALKDRSGKVDGVAAAGLKLAMTLPEPPPPLNSQIHGKTAIVIDFGRSTAQTDLSPQSGFTGVTTPPGPTNLGPTIGGDTRPVTSSDGSIITMPTNPDGSGLTPEVAPGQARLSSRQLNFADSTDIYLLLIVGTLFAFVATQLIRILGVKRACGSGS